MTFSAISITETDIQESIHINNCSLHSQNVFLPFSPLAKIHIHIATIIAQPTGKTHSELDLNCIFRSHKQPLQLAHINTWPKIR